MSKDTISEFKTPEAERTDPLTELPRAGAQQLIASAVEAEQLELLGHYADSKDEQGARSLCATATCRHERFRPALDP